MPHISIDLRAEFRAGVVEPWLAGHARGLTPNPCVRCNGNVRIDAMLALAERLGAQTLATGHYARLPSSSTPTGAAGLCCAWRPTREGPELRPRRLLRPPPSPACAFPWASCESPRCASTPARRGLAVAGQRDSQDLCFLAGSGRARFLERHGRLGRRARADPRSRRAACSASTTARTASRSASAAAWGSAGETRCTCWRPTRRATRSRSVRASSCSPARWSCAEVTLHLPAPTVDSVKIRYRGRAVAVPSAGARTAAGPPCGRERRARGADRAHRPGAARVPVRRASCSSATGPSPPELGRHVGRPVAGVAPSGDSRGLSLRSGSMTSDEIRESYLAFFEERGHLRIPSASLVPSAHDPSALLTVAGMHPLKPYFLGRRDAAGAPPDELPEELSRGRHRQGRGHDQAPDVLRDARQLLLRGLLQAGGDRLRVGALARGLRPRRRGHLGDGLRRRRRARPRPRRGGDRDLDVRRGPARADRRMPALGELLAGRPDGAVRALLGALPRPGPSRSAAPRISRAARTSASSSTGTSSSPSTTCSRRRPASASGSRRLPARNIDTGLGLNRMAAILQGKDSVFETDQFWPLIELGQELSGRSYGEEWSSDRALRILADHGRATTFLIADGVVPSNEDRGYVLRRVMRRAIQQGRSLAMEPGFLTRYGERVRELMAGAYPELVRAVERDRTLAGLRGGELRAHARPGQPPARGADRPRPGAGVHDDRGQRRFHAPRHLRLPLRGHARAARRARPRGRGGELCRADGGPARPRPRRRRRRRRRRRGVREQARELAEEAGSPTRFTGYETDAPADHRRGRRARPRWTRTRTVASATSSSWRSRPSTPPVGARSPTRA